MSRLEAEARDNLLRRRRTLSSESLGAAGDVRATRGEGAPGAPNETAQRELAEIDAALLRIEEGCYGTCLRCGGPMGLQRLRAIPEARYCVACSGQAVATE